MPKVNNAHDHAVKDSKVAPFRLYDLRHTWATRLTNSTDTRMCLLAFMGDPYPGFNFALLCHETIHPPLSRTQAKDAGKDSLPSSDASLFSASNWTARRI